MVDVRFILTEAGMRYDVYSPAKTIRAHILLPNGKNCKALLINGKETPFSLQKVAASTYVNADVASNKMVSLEILF